MKIKLEQVGKRYHQHWIFKGINTSFESGQRIAVLGTNGSGKSTLLRILAGMQHASKGQLSYSTQSGKTLPSEKLFQHLSYCAPAMDLVEELSLEELLDFHFTFKKIKGNHTPKSILDALDMYAIRNKTIHEFSSGMKQRVKLAQAFFSDTSLLILDEPCSNLDQQGVALYHQWLNSLTEGRLTIIGSNDPREYPDSDQQLHITDYQ